MPYISTRFRTDKVFQQQQGYLNSLGGAATGDVFIFV
jgi:hypothetical protein